VRGPHVRARTRLGSEHEFFEGLYREHYAKLFAYIARRAGRDIAHDVVAETFLVAWRRLHSVPPEQLPWLIGIARNRLANENRSERRRERLRVRLEAHEPRGQRGRVDELATEREGLSEAFGRLSSADREILTLIAWEELSLKEAAIVLGVSYVGCRVRFYRAKTRFLAQLQANESQTRRNAAATCHGAREAQ
jgi:RNA polymerase sigma-70 factor, ECF subfamily